MFVLSGLSKNTSFPGGFSAPYEAEVLARGGEFIGGQGLVQLVSYSESPVGEYDELIYIPGRWKYSNGEVGFRITRIYVSTKESTENGRRNWNIPKQVANFDYRPGPDGTTTFSVTLPGPGSTPFFKASIRPIPLLSSLSIPFSTTILGSYFSLMQPPLPKGENPEEVSTDKWAALTPVMKGNTRVVKLIPGFEDGSVGDGVGFPKVKPWSIASVMEGLDLDFGVPKLFEEV
ncbi:hypothetical protein P691DRAFT_675398 [Macrolepiota fuliginosa MF-IS2]|uniref:Acetoacetate decarboxylase n=1 Tax=Macrolepiota fuliginosa MF-IS2 TaxID=1400762 RepID=A0A9P5X7M0_9AGAR|nr:hypothetical protein P691DRAFT_675398 [Macrolepiota fuliginosa MF-IS2]